MSPMDGKAAGNTPCPVEGPTHDLGFFERYLTAWVLLCILGGIVLGKLAPGVATYLDGLAIHVDEAPVVSIPIAICLFFMMYPIMVKIDFAEVVKASTNVKPVGLTLVVNWAIKPFTMYGIAVFFLGTLFYHFIGPEAVDYVKMPLGLDLPVGASHGAGTVVMHQGVKALEVPLWRTPAGSEADRRLQTERVVVLLLDPVSFPEERVFDLENRFGCRVIRGIDSISIKSYIRINGYTSTNTLHIA